MSSDQITDAELDAMEARANAATPGPWKSDIEGVWAASTCKSWQPDICDSWNEDNSRFIASAREDMPRLIKALREARDQEKANAIMLAKRTREYDSEAVYARCLLERAEKAEAERDAWQASSEVMTNAMHKAEAERDALRDKLKTAVEVLRFYAEPSTYGLQTACSGGSAREALCKIGEVE